MAIYSIKDLEKLSGIKAATIRIWEQRYGLVVPERTPTNIRYYTDADLRKLLNVALLNKNGYKISRLAQMPYDEINARVAAIADVPEPVSDTLLDTLTIAMIELDEYRFEKILATNIQQLGFEQAMLEIVLPFLDRLSTLWLTGSIKPVQENFVSNLIRQKLIVAIDNEPITTTLQSKKFLVYLPEGEMQELSVLFMMYLLKSRKYRVIYVGLNITHNDLIDAYSINKPDYIFTIISETFAKKSVQHYANTLAENFTNAHILLTGYQVVAQQVKPLRNMTILQSLAQTIHFLDKIATKSTHRSSE